MAQRLPPPGYRCPGDAPPPEAPSTPLGEGRLLRHCPGVYEPAEDTWLAWSLVEELLASRRFRVCIDVGTGTGALAAACLAKVQAVAATDVNPCAAACAHANLSRLGPATVAGVAQCDTLTCIRCPLEHALLVYNTPYLPPPGGDEPRSHPLLEASWSGGLPVVREAAARLAGCAGPGSCVVLVYSSLTGPRGEVLRPLLERGLRVVAEERLHRFFEDIVVTAACSPGGEG